MSLPSPTPKGGLAVITIMPRAPYPAFSPRGLVAKTALLYCSIAGGFIVSGKSGRRRLARERGGEGEQQKWRAITGPLLRYFFSQAFAPATPLPSSLSLPLSTQPSVSRERRVRGRIDFCWAPKPKGRTNSRLRVLPFGLQRERHPVICPTKRALGTESKPALLFF